MAFSIVTENMSRFFTTNLPVLFMLEIASIRAAAVFAVGDNVAPVWFYTIPAETRSL